jgi:hypothetical protein
MIARRYLLKKAALAGGALLGALLINQGGFRLFAQSTTGPAAVFGPERGCLPAAGSIQAGR